MSKKDLAFKPATNASTTPEDWIEKRDKPAAPAEPTKRLTVDIPQSLHKRIRLACIEHDEVMADVIRDILQKAFQGTDLD
jgi:proline-rich tail region repeat protein